MYTQNIEEYRTSRWTNEMVVSRMLLLREENYIHLDITLLLQEYTPTVCCYIYGMLRIARPLFQVYN